MTDSPGAKPIGTTDKIIDFDDKFDSYVMYLPFGTSSKLVPLKKRPWTAKRAVEKTNGTPPWTYTTPDASAFGLNSGAIPPHPEWTWYWFWDGDPLIAPDGDWWVDGWPN